VNRFSHLCFYNFIRLHFDFFNLAFSPIVIAISAKHRRSEIVPTALD
jgi:hypothetical protein